MMTHGSLFTGIGGFDLGFERAGIETLWQVEINEECREELAKHYPNVERFSDVRECGKHNLRTVDIVSGGFPCQPHSLAGDRQASSDERDLWPEFYRIICELEPRWVVAENVPWLLSSEDGRFFGNILRDLALGGYHATWQVLRARDFGAFHRRERVFIVANRERDRIEGYWKGPLPQLPEFSWCKNVRRVEDLRNRPGIFEPAVCRGSYGFSVKVDLFGNAVIPGIVQYIGNLIRIAEGFGPYDWREEITHLLGKRGDSEMSMTYW